MEKIKLTSISSSNGAGSSPIIESDLHGYVDQQLTQARRIKVDQYLSAQPDERQRIQEWQQQNELLRSWLNPVLEEPLPMRLPLKPSATIYPWRGFAAGIAIAAVSASFAWVVRGSVDVQAARLALATSTRMMDASSSDLTGFALRAAVAHLVYSPDVRRPVEVGADQEQQLVTWLSKRLGTAVKPPRLQGIGYELIGGRLLPGDTGPVAQFMYHDAAGQRLTLYVTRELPKLANQPETSFRFGQDGLVNVFYWVDKSFGYAISGGTDRKELMRVSQEVYRQLASG